MTKEEAIELLERDIYNANVSHHITEHYKMAIQALEQEPRKGKWIFTKTIFDNYGRTVECPSCYKKWKTYDEIRWKRENKFCPNCGADMRESEDKE